MRRFLWWLTGLIRKSEARYWIRVALGLQEIEVNT
jgi:hypothetical protein